MSDAGQPSNRRLDEITRRAIAEKRIVGSVIVAYRDGQLVHHAAYGLADREADVPTRPNQIFRLASLTKPIVTAAALRLVEEGRLSLSAAVTDYLPDFRPRLPDSAQPTITLHHLLTHTSGLSYQFLQPLDGPYNRLRISSGVDQPGLSMSEEISRLATAPLGFAPGAQWMYSNGLDVLGAAMEQAAGQALPDIIASRVTGPLGMADTGFAPPDRARLAAAYGNGNPKPVLMGEPFSLPLVPGGPPALFSPARVFNAASFPSGGAGMNGTAEDVARFLECIRTGGAPILERPSATSMMTHQIGDLRMVFSPGGGWGFGYGGAVLLDPAKAGSVLSPGSWWWGGVWGANWFVDPARKLTVVAVTNTAFEGMSGQYALEQPAAACADA